MGRLRSSGASIVAALDAAHPMRNLYGSDSDILQSGALHLLRAPGDCPLKRRRSTHAIPDAVTQKLQTIHAVRIGPRSVDQLFGNLVVLSHASGIGGVNESCAKKKKPRSHATCGSG